MISAFEYALVINNNKSKTKAKIQCLLNGLTSYDTLNSACIYLDVFEKISVTSMILESNNNIPIDISATTKHILHWKTLKKTADKKIQIRQLSA